MRKLLIITLILCGLLRLTLYYSGLPYNSITLGPLTHTFTFASSLSEAELVVSKTNGETLTQPLKIKSWDLSSNFGFFVRRAKISSLLGFVPLENLRPDVLRLRKHYLCNQETSSIFLKTRRYSTEDFSQLFRLDCI